GKAELLDAGEAGRVERVPEADERQRLVEPEPEHHALPRAHLVVEPLDLALRRTVDCERREIASELRPVLPPLALDCRNRADPQAEVVVAEPVAEVVPRTQVPRVVLAAEIGRLVPENGRASCSGGGA